MVLGQIRTVAKANGITAIPKLVEMLDLEECIVAIDAIARTILNAKADYVPRVKGNQGSDLDAVKYLFNWEEREWFREMFHAEYKEHGQI